MNKKNLKIYSLLIRNSAMYADQILSGLFEVLESRCLNGNSIELKNEAFRGYIVKLSSHITDLAYKQIPLEQAKSKLKMSLAENRRIVQVVDRVFEGVSGDASAISIKKTHLIGPTMRLRKSLHDAMSILEKGEGNG